MANIRNSMGCGPGRRSISQSRGREKKPRVDAFSFVLLKSLSAVSKAQTTSQYRKVARHQSCASGVIQAWEIVMNWLLGSKARVGLIAVLVGLSQAMHANAQTSDGVGVWVQVTPADQAPVQNSATGHPHYLPARGPNEAKARKQQVVQAWQNFTSHAATTVSASSAVSGSTSAS